jgi:plastocyanin
VAINDQVMPAPQDGEDVMMTRRQLLAAVGGASVLTAVVAACSDDGPRVGPAPPPTVEPNGIVVNVQSIDNSFRPSRLEVSPGTEVVWTNLGRTEHDILAMDGSWGVEPKDFQPGATFSHVFGGVGEVPYYCSIHADAALPTFGMVGTIAVVEA